MSCVVSLLNSSGPQQFELPPTVPTIVSIDNDEIWEKIERHYGRTFIGMLNGNVIHMKDGNDHATLAHELTHWIMRYNNLPDSEFLPEWVEARHYWCD